MKTCTKCGVEKSLSEFHRSSRVPDGFQRWCKRCAASAKKRSLAKKPEKYREMSRRHNAERRLRNPEAIKAEKRRDYEKNKGGYIRRVKERRERVPECRRWEALKRKYRIDQAGYEALLEAQGGVCAICALPPKSGEPLHVDHDHQSGEVRGLLCLSCNVRAGFIEHPLYEATLAYLSRSKERVETPRSEQGREAA